MSWSPADSSSLCAAHPCSLCWPQLQSAGAQCNIDQNFIYENITLRNITIVNPQFSYGQGVILGNPATPMKVLSMVWCCYIEWYPGLSEHSVWWGESGGCCCSWAWWLPHLSRCSVWNCNRGHQPCPPLLPGPHRFPRRSLKKSFIVVTLYQYIYQIKRWFILHYSVRKKLLLCNTCI